MPADFGRRFVDLLDQANAIDAARRPHATYGPSAFEIDETEFLNWLVKTRHLLEVICGTKSQYFHYFKNNEHAAPYTTPHEALIRLRAILQAAKEDYDGGYLTTIRALIQAEMFEDELEQAEELQNAGYFVAAAVIAGVVLETHLRRMCVDQGLSLGNLNTMNTELAKAGAYTKLELKLVTYLADIRNKAAHGEGGFDREAVSNMIRDVRAFLIKFSG